MVASLNISDLENRLSYEFRNKDLLHQALRHSSYVNEMIEDTLEDNERFEFLGDAVLSLIVGHTLMNLDPNLKEGDLSRIRANLVNESQLASLARKLSLGTYVLLGKGEILSCGHKKDSILANTFEALVAAIYLDGGFERTFQIINGLYSDLTPSIHTATFNQDFKSRLQEYVQATKQNTPAYRIIREMGPDHDKTFVVELRIDHLQSEGVGKSKKIAEQEAARKALDILLSSSE